MVRDYFYDGMDIKTIFRNLVTNQYMENFDYVHTRFSFLTLFHKSPYCYCCCPCSYEHEYFKYISDGSNVENNVDEEMYNKILSNILKGKCPHVEGQPTDYVSETTVYAIQIAAVVGTEQAVEEHMKDYLKIRGGGIFKQRACEIATLKNKYQDLLRCCNELPKLSGILSGWKTPVPPILLPVTNGSKGGNGTRIELTFLEHIEFFIQRRNSTLLKSLLLPSIYHEHLENAFKLVFRNKLQDMGDALADYYRDLLQREVIDFPDSCAETAIMYDQPKILQKILSSRNRWTNETQRRLEETCQVMVRRECEIILSQNNVHMVQIESESKQVSRLLALLADFCDDFGDEIVDRLRAIPDLPDVINQPMTQSFPEKRYWIVTPLAPLQYYLEKSISVRKLDSRVVETMLELGATIDSCNAIIPPNGHALHSEYWSTVSTGDPVQYRRTLEILLNENPNTELNTEAVKTGIQLDVFLKMPKMRDKADLTGDYIMDGKEHSLLGHNGKDNYPFNFIGPLLIECGFPYTQDTLLFALDKQLHPEEHTYMQDCLENPRSLKLRCRDKIRKHFPGRKIHEFVQSANIPLLIKDFILMKSLLRNI